ncbi:hypothetical protein QP303_11205, partial [Escherichia coli]|nr:hypothetical protein [Escherichia coli]MDK8067208.1 hypothetical protein [Escherichia coli]MDW6996233.1 hypothetical protein [Escherichia coli]
GGTADRNRSHWSTSKTPSYTKSVSWHHHHSNESSNVRERFVRIIAYNEESYKSKIAIDDESPLSIHLDHFKKITSALLKKK